MNDRDQKDRYRKSEHNDFIVAFIFILLLTIVALAVGN